MSTVIKLWQNVVYTPHPIKVGRPCQSRKATASFRRFVAAAWHVKTSSVKTELVACLWPRKDL